MIRDESLYSLNETKASINESINMRNDIQIIIEENDKLKYEVSDNSIEYIYNWDRKLPKLDEILEKLKKFEFENYLASDFKMRLKTK